VVAVFGRTAGSFPQFGFKVLAQPGRRAVERYANLFVLGHGWVCGHYTVTAAKLLMLLCFGPFS
jgi:hypothetical protein